MRVDLVMWQLPPSEIRRGSSSLERCCGVRRALLCADDELLGVH